MKDLIKEIKSRIEYLEKVNEDYISSWELGYHDGERATLRFILEELEELNNETTKR